MHVYKGIDVYLVGGSGGPHPEKFYKLVAKGCLFGPEKLQPPFLLSMKKNFNPSLLMKKKNFNPPSPIYRPPPPD